MKTIPNGDGSVRPDYPAPVVRLVGLLLRLLWHCIPTQWLGDACNARMTTRRDRIVLWIHSSWPLWDWKNGYHDK